MILSPIQNTAVKYSGGFMQVRPRITQIFGVNADIYKQFGLLGHNGLDFGSNGDDNIFAPFNGQVQVRDDGKKGYGLHIKLRDNNKECVLAHFSEVYVKDGDQVSLGTKLAKMGNSGFSTGKHLHFGLRFVASTGSLWSRAVLNADNGYKGYVDPLDYVIWWKGAGSKSTLD